MAVFIALFAGQLVSAQPANPARVAIIGTDQPDMAALLTARLGREPGVQLLERDEVQRIVQEHALPKNAAEDSPALGKLLGADYLIFLESVKEAAGESVQARVVWCEPGAVLASITLPDKIEATRRADWLAERIIPWLHKAPVQDVRRISLLGLRCITDSAENELLERELNAALSARLEGDPGFVVLERWHMDDLVFEKSVSNITDSPFWLAADVVDGAITPSKNKIEVQVRVREAANAGTKEFQCEGTRDGMAALADSIAKQLQKDPAAALEVRDGKSEAEAFYREGNWLLDQGLPEEAVQATESAWALGRQDAGTAANRVEAYAKCASPIEPVAYYVHGGGCIPPGAISLAEMPRSVRLACQTMYLAGDYMLAHGSTRSQPHRPVDVAMNPPYETADNWNAPVTLGFCALHTGLVVLRAAYETGLQLIQPALVAELREAIRDNIDIIQNLNPGKPKGYFLAYLADYAGYWNESPADAIAFYREILSMAPIATYPNWHWYIRDEICAANEVPVIDWARADQSEAHREWIAYVEELLHANDPLQHADGLMFKFSSLPDAAAREAYLQEIVSFLVASPEVLTSTDGPAIIADLGGPLHGLADPAGHSRLLNCCIGLLGQSKLMPGVLSLIPILTTRPMFSPGGVGAPYTRDEAVRLVAALRNHEKSAVQFANADYIREISETESTVTRPYPDLAKRDLDHSLHVTRLWEADKFAKGQGSVDPESGVCVDDYLIFDSFATGGRLWKIHLPGFETEVSGTPTATAALPGKIYSASEDSVLAMNCGDFKPYKLDLPAHPYSISVMEGALWAAYRPSWTPTDKRGGDSGLYRVDLKTDEAKLICSTRRRPPVHPLDTLEYISPTCFLPSGNGWPILGTYGESGIRFFHTDTGAAWPKTAFPRCSAAARDYDGGVLLTATILRGWSNDVLCGVVRVTNQGKYDALIWNPKYRPVAEAAPVWNFPVDFGVQSAKKDWEKYFRPAMSGDELYVLAGYRVFDNATHCIWGSPDITLYCFRPGKRDPVAIPLIFDLDESHKKQPDSDSNYDLNYFLYPTPSESGMLATPAGLVITDAGMHSAFWFIPRADLDAAIAAAGR